jgi:hypothetical protein
VMVTPVIVVFRGHPVKVRVSPNPMSSTMRRRMAASSGGR